MSKSPPLSLIQFRPSSAIKAEEPVHAYQVPNAAIRFGKEILFTSNLFLPSPQFLY